MECQRARLSSIKVVVCFSVFGHTSMCQSLVSSLEGSYSRTASIIRNKLAAVLEFGVKIDEGSSSHEETTK